MALIQPSPLVGAMRGSVGPLVFSNSFAGPTARMNWGQLRTASLAAQLIKGNVTKLSKAWGGLTPTQRQGWKTFGIAYPRTNKLGATFIMPGNIAFIAINQALKAAGVTTELDDAPMTYTAGTPNALTPTWDPIGQTITLSPTSAPGADEVPIVWSTRAQSPGKNPKHPKITKLQVFGAGVTGPWDITTNWTAKYGPFLPNYAITFQVQYTNNLTGAQGIPALVQQILTP